MTFLTDLDQVLRERGVKVTTHPGWKTRGYNGMSFTEVRGTLWHHTATHRSRFVGDDAPTLDLCINGRADLAGPLCQIVLGRDGTAHVIAAGWGNHAGYGSYKGIPTNQGNAYLIGVEMESSGLPPYDWTLAQLQAIPVLRDALRDGYGHQLDIGHMEWSSQGKIDPAGLPGGMDWLRTAKAGKPATVKPATAKSKPKAKSIGQLADEVIAGKHGSGDARQNALGAKYAAVQAEVNRRLSGKAAPKPKAKSIAQLADEVIAGKHGSGDARKKALGAKYNAVQAEVNRKLIGKAKPKSIAQLATEVIAGKHGTGDARKRALGSQYAAVQAEVNRRLT